MPNYIFKIHFDAYQVESKNDLCDIDYTNSTIFIDNSGYFILYSDIFLNGNVLTYIVSRTGYSAITPYTKKNLILERMYRVTDILDENGELVSQESSILYE